MRLIECALLIRPLRKWRKVNLVEVSALLLFAFVFVVKLAALRNFAAFISHLLPILPMRASLRRSTINLVDDLTGVS